MNELYPIVRRVRRPLLPEETRSAELGTRNESAEEVQSPVTVTTKDSGAKSEGDDSRRVTPRKEQ